jgi:hypothetical protein
MNEYLARAHLRPKSENSPPAALPEPSTGYQFLRAAHAKPPIIDPLVVAPAVNPQLPLSKMPATTPPPTTSAPQPLQAPNRATNLQWMDYWNGRGPRPAPNTYFDPRYHQIEPTPTPQQWMTQGTQNLPSIHQKQRKVAHDLMPPFDLAMEQGIWPGNPYTGRGSGGLVDFSFQPREQVGDGLINSPFRVFREWYLSHFPPVNFRSPYPKN